MSSIETKRIFAPALELLEGAFRLLEKQVPPPRRKPWKDSFVFRYSEQTIQQAIVQKLARSISGLHAIYTLLDRGVFQEQCVIQRVLDELDEDVVFLSLGVINNDVTERHREYLKYFYAEEFEDPEDIPGSHSSRGMVRRDKIRAYINKSLETDQSRANANSRLLAKAYSGYVHAASPQVMDMCGGDPPRFDVSGEFRSLRAAEHENDAMNYFFRVIASAAFAAKAFGAESLFSKLCDAAAEFEGSMNLIRQRRGV